MEAYQSTWGEVRLCRPSGSRSRLSYDSTHPNRQTKAERSLFEIIALSRRDHQRRSWNEMIENRDLCL